MAMRDLLCNGVEVTAAALRVASQASSEDNYTSPESVEAFASRLRIAHADVRGAWESVATMADERANRASCIAEAASDLQAKWEDVAAKARAAATVSDSQAATYPAVEAAETAEEASIALAPTLRRSILR